MASVPEEPVDAAEIPVEEDQQNEMQDNKICWVEDHPECSVCLQPCLQPVQLPCTHIFCFLCLKGFAYRSKRCALCRREIQLQYFEEPVVVKVKSKEACNEPKIPMKDEYDWFYEGRNGWWQYDERASKLIEEAFKSEVRSCEILVAGFSYVIDFENMVQYRKSNPIRCRRVKRDRANVERKGVAGLKESKEKEKIESETEHGSEKPESLLKNTPNNGSPVTSHLPNNDSPAPPHLLQENNELSGTLNEVCERLSQLRTIENDQGT